MVVSGNNLMYFIITSRYTRILYLHRRRRCCCCYYCIFHFFCACYCVLTTRLSCNLNRNAFTMSGCGFVCVVPSMKMNVKRKHEIMFAKIEVDSSKQKSESHALAFGTIPFCVSEMNAVNAHMRKHRMCLSVWLSYVGKVQRIRTGRLHS